jgi:flagellar basal body-associated protein FliL
MEPEDSQEPEQPQKPSKGYGKRPMWQWVVIYLVIAIIVYGLIYLLFIHKGGGTGGSSY